MHVERIERGYLGCCRLTDPMEWLGGGRRGCGGGVPMVQFRLASRNVVRRRESGKKDGGCDSFSGLKFLFVLI